MEIVTRSRVDAWVWFFFGPIALSAAVLSVFFGGLEWALYWTLLVAASISVTFLASRCRGYRRATVDEIGVTLRTEWQGSFAAKPFFFRWAEVAKVRRSPPLARSSEAGLCILLDRPGKFWTFQPQPPNRAKVPPSLAHNKDFREALRRHVAPECIAVGALNSEAPQASLRWRVFGALILLPCAGWAAWGSAEIIQGGNLISGIAPLVGSLLGMGLLLVRCAPPPTPLALMAGTWVASLFCAKAVFVFSAFAGNYAPIVGYLAATAGALMAAVVLILIDCPRWRHAALFYALAGIGFATGIALYGDTAPTRIAPGSLLPFYHSCWTPSGDGFLLSTVTHVEDVPPGPVDMQWYSDDLRPGNRLTLPQNPFVPAIGEEGALAVTRTDDLDELWFLPRRSGAPRKLTASESLRQFHESPSKRCVVFCCVARKEEIWDCCDMTRGELSHFDLPPAMGHARPQWGKDDSSLIWTSGGRPSDANGSFANWKGPLPEKGIFKEPGALYRLWVWRKDRAPLNYAARTQWLDFRLVASEGRFYVCRFAEQPPLRKEFVTIDISEQEIRTSPTTEEAFATHIEPPPLQGGPYEIAGFHGFRTRPIVVETATGRLCILKNDFPLLGMSWDWSPRGDRFLTTSFEWRLPKDFWRWRRNPIKNLMNCATVYQVKIEPPPRSGIQKGDKLR